MTRVVTIELERDVFRAFESPRPLRIVAVQLESPFASPLSPGLISPDRSDERLQWDSREKEEARAIQVRDILEAIVEGADERATPDIILFPEYSVPESTHSGNAFQRFADRHRCIVVPGTYYGRTDPRLSRLNVCRVYIPGRARPAVIVKKHPTPSEAKYLASSGSRANVLQMLLKITDDKTISLNVFICRDYLLPYDNEGLRERAKLWAFEGINFVLMHNEEARLFEGQAAPEVRRLRGPGRVVVFVNNASTCCDLGTALLGPARNRERDDIVKSVPWDREGMLIASVRPWDVRHQETRPDRKEDSPIAGATVSLFDIPSVGPVRFQPGHHPPAHRAVWKPAFLEAIKRVIVIDFRVARRLSHTIRALSEKNARFYAVAIRGVQDVIIRRYAYRDEKKGGGEIPPLASFFTGLSDADLSQLFEERNKIRIVIHPRDVLKYRGIDTRDDQRFHDNVKKIAHELGKLRSKDLNAYMDRLDKVGSLASEINPELGIDDDVAAYFFKEVEEHIPIGYEFNNNIRETYVLLALGAPDERLRREFHNEMVAGALMNDSSVREIFYIRTMDGDLHFNYLIKTKAKDYETDRIIRNLRTWREAEEVVVQTRTFDVTDYLKNSSVLGVANFDQGTSMSEFADALSQEDGLHLLEQVDFENRLNRRRIALLASEWSKAKKVALETDVDDQLETIDEIYVNICFMCFSGGRNPDEYKQRAMSALLNLYRTLEDVSIDIVASLVGARPPVAGPVLGAEVARLCPRVLKNSIWDKISDHPEKVLLAHFSDLFPGISGSAEAKSKLTSARQSLSRAGNIRNSLVHGRRSALVDSLLHMSSDAWEDSIREVGEYVADILRVLAALESLRGFSGELREPIGPEIPEFRGDNI